MSTVSNTTTTDRSRRVAVTGAAIAAAGAGLVMSVAAPGAAAAATAQHYYVGHSAGRTHCLYVGPSWDARLGARTVDYATIGSRSSRNLEWTGPAASGWQSGHVLVEGHDRAGRPTMRPGARTAVSVSGHSSVVFSYRRDGRATVTSPRLHSVDWMSYVTAGCPTD